MVKLNLIIFIILMLVNILDVNFDKKMSKIFLINYIFKTILIFLKYYFK